jgi:ribonuclease HI
VYDGITSYVDKRLKNDWKWYNKKPVLNQDLWYQLEQLRHGLPLERYRVKAHAHDDDNNMVDDLARWEAEKLARKK